METLNASMLETIIGTSVVIGGAFFLTMAEEPIKRYFKLILQRIKTK